MRVTTIDGGFRGRKTSALGALPSAQSATEGEGFEARLRAYRAQRAKITSPDGIEAADALDLAIEAHLAALATVEGPESLMAWRTQSGEIVAQATRLLDLASGTGSSNPKYLWIVGSLILGTAVVGTTAWWLASKRKS